MQVMGLVLFCCCCFVFLFFLLMAGDAAGQWWPEMSHKPLTFTVQQKVTEVSAWALCSCSVALQLQGESSSPSSHPPCASKETHSSGIEVGKLKRLMKQTKAGPCGQ